MARIAQASAKTRPPVIVFCPPKRARILAQSAERALFDLFDRSDPGDLAVLRRLCLARCRPAPVVVDERPRLLAIHREALAHGFLAVVVALDQRLAGEVVP